MMLHRLHVITILFAAVYLKQFTTSPVSQQVLLVLEQAIREERIRKEIGIDDIPDLKTLMEKLGRVVGFDPLESIESVTVYGTSSPFDGKIHNEQEFAL